jgi:hypothetical protein
MLLLQRVAVRIYAADGTIPLHVLVKRVFAEDFLICVPQFKPGGRALVFRHKPGGDHIDAITFGETIRQQVGIDLPSTSVVTGAGGQNGEFFSCSPMVKSAALAIDARVAIRLPLPDAFCRCHER